MADAREVTVLGSTGSIGTQAIQVAQQNPERLRITALAAGGGDVARLAQQALTLGVRTVAVAKATVAQDLQLAFYAVAQQRGWAKGQYALPEILAGPRAAEELAARPTDVVLNGITGSIGLRPTLSALRAGNTVALANKESLVAGGDLVTAAAAVTRSPPATSDSLLASATVRPARSADNVGPNPIEPVIPLRTTSAGRAASSSAARGPARISGRAYSPFAQPRWDAAA